MSAFVPGLHRTSTFFITERASERRSQQRRGLLIRTFLIFIPRQERSTRRAARLWSERLLGNKSYRWDGEKVFRSVGVSEQVKKSAGVVKTRWRERDHRLILKSRRENAADSSSLNKCSTLQDSKTSCFLHLKVFWVSIRADRNIVRLQWRQHRLTRSWLCLPAGITWWRSRCDFNTEKSAVTFHQHLGKITWTWCFMQSRKCCLIQAAITLPPRNLFPVLNESYQNTISGRRGRQMGNNVAPCHGCHQLYELQTKHCVKRKRWV